ncbi:MAG: hypothetical protein R3C68_12780 [Myxococcota bacterium]
MKNPTEATTDKRESPRAPIELKVEYKRMNTFFADYTKNISKEERSLRRTKLCLSGPSFSSNWSCPNATPHLF